MLDTPTTSASGPSPTESRAALERRLKGRRDAWSLRTLVGGLLPGHRVEGCGRHLVPGKAATVVRHDDRHTLGNVRKCGSVWLCPVCQHKIASGRSTEVQRAVAEAIRRGLDVYMVTLTVAHSASDELGDILPRFVKARRGLWSGRRAAKRRAAFGILGTIGNAEVTWGRASGWHPHSHVLVFADTTGDDELGGLLAESLWQGWQLAATRHGFRVARGGFDVVRVDLDERSLEEVAAYVTKPPASAKRAWKVGEELAASGSKHAAIGRYAPFDLVAGWLDAGDSELLFRFYEYAHAYAGWGRGKGRRHVFWSRGLRDELLIDTELDDETLANADGDGEVVAVLTQREWIYLRTHDLTREFLEVCDLNGIQAAMQWLATAATGAHLDEHIRDGPAPIIRGA